LICHILLDLLPEAGLEEAFDSLLTAYEYHRLPATQPALPPTRKLLPARIARTFERPVVSVVEE
jgi:hypothetical protein